MKIYTKVVIDMASMAVVDEDFYEYNGPISKCYSSGGSGGDSTITQRYADYIEGHQKSVLTMMATQRDFATEQNPYTDFAGIYADDGFLDGAGNPVTNYTCLFDLFDDYMHRSVESIWNTVFSNTENKVGPLVAAEAALLDDDIETNILPRFEEGMRDINSVMSSTFVIGRALIESARVKSLAKFDAELRYRFVEVVKDRWVTTLEWNHKVVYTYAEILKLYYSTKMDLTSFRYEIKSKELLWPFTIHEYERAMLGAMEGAYTTTKSVAGESGAGKAISGALSGAAMGAMIGSKIHKLAIGGMSSAMTGGIGGALLGIASTFI